MQVIRQASKGRSGLRLWSRALGIKANRKTPPRQPLTGVTLWGCLVGLMLTTGVGWAHTDGEPLPMPTCSGLPADAFFDGTGTNPGTPLSLNAANPTGSGNFDSYDNADKRLRPKQGDENESEQGNSAFQYGKITVPALTAGELTVTIAANRGSGANLVNQPTNAVLCIPGNSQALATGSTSYAGPHADADAAGAAATAAATAAAEAARLAGLDANNEDRATVSDVSNAVRAAINALAAAEDALDDLNDVDGQTVAPADFTTIADAITVLEALGAITASNAYATGTTNALTGANSALTTAAGSLTGAFATVHEGVAMTAYLDSGVEEYIVVLATDHTSLPDVNVRFAGLMGTGELTRLIGSTSSADETETFTFRTNVAGLFKGNTAGRAVSGELSPNDGIDIGTGMVEIAAPLTTPGPYTLTVTDQGGSGGGEFTFSAWFRSSTSLTSPTTVPVSGEIMAGKSNYYHFTAGPSILTIGATAVRDTPAGRVGVDTKGTLYSGNGNIAMNTGKAGIVGFEIMMPVTADTYILEVEGDTPQVAGRFTLTSQEDTATSLSIPSSGTLIDAESQNFVFNVQQGGGWLQVKTDVASGVTGVQTTATLSANGMRVGSHTGDPLANFAVMVSEGLHLLVVEKTGTGTANVALTFIEAVAFQTPPTIVPADNTALVAACEQEIMDGNYMPTGYVPTTGSEFETACRDADFVRTVRVGGGGGGGGGRTRTVEIPPSEAECRRYTQVETDATGNLENPSPGGYRSGVSVISGWACSANDVTIAIYDSDGEQVERMNAGYGTSRRDVQMAERCDHDSELVGFGLTYNFNLLSAGEYTIRALADNQRIGEQSFTIVHVSDDPFDEDLMGMCTAEDFPEAGYETELMWEESIQNFVIHEVMDVSMAQ